MKKCLKKIVSKTIIVGLLLTGGMCIATYFISNWIVYIVLYLLAILVLFLLFKNESNRCSDEGYIDRSDITDVVFVVNVVVLLIFGTTTLFVLWYVSTHTAAL